MQIHELQPSHTTPPKKRIGRGGKRGTYSGRGIKGQRAHAGGRLPSPERTLISRFPKLRGASFNPLRGAAVVLNVGDIETLFDDKATITKDALIDRGVLQNKKERVKILGDGTLTKSVTITGVPVSAQAHKKIEAAGGSVTT